MATVCKTVRRKSYAGSNPAPTTKTEADRQAFLRDLRLLLGFTVTHGMACSDNHTWNVS